MTSHGKCEKMEGNEVIETEWYMIEREKYMSDDGTVRWLQRESIISSLCTVDKLWCTFSIR